MSLESLLAEKLFENSKVLEYKHNTIFTAIDQYGINSPMVTTAINGVSNIIANKVNIYRNNIIPDAEAIEAKLKEVAIVPSHNVTDDVSLHVLNYQSGFDLLKELDLIDPLAVADPSMLPNKVAYINYDEDLVSGAFRTGNNKLDSYIKEILLEYKDSYVKELHEKLFLDLRKSNKFLNDLILDPIDNHNDILLSLILVLHYVNNTVGVTNIDPKELRVQYLYKLRDILSSSLAHYAKLYQRDLERDAFIVGVDKGHVTLIGEAYSKYLEEHSIDAIIGYAKTETKPIKYNKFIEHYQFYTEKFEEAVKVSYYKSNINLVSRYRHGYELAVRKFLEDTSDSNLDQMGFSRADIPVVVAEVSKYCRELKEEEIMETTETSRYITAVMLYDMPDFLEFSDYMEHYARVFPKYDITEVGTLATAAITMDLLSDQLVVTDINVQSKHV